MAQAVYEELKPADRETLDNALAGSEELRAEAKALGLLVERIPQDSIEFSGDLTPAVRAGILEVSTTFSLSKTYRFTALAAVLLLLSGVAYRITMRPPSDHTPTVAQLPAEPEEILTALDTAMIQAESLLLERQYSTAYVTLSDALDGGHQDPKTGEARQLMADLAYAELQWYPEAYANYEALRVRHSAVFQSTPENLMKLNLLEEARGRDGRYASLLALDAARRGESLSDLEELLGDYPATYVASLAAEEMAALSAHLDGLQQGGVDWKVAAMESALAHTTNPVARAQLKVEIGHLVSQEMDDAVRARALYEEVAESGITVVAELAQNSLERLDAEGL